MAKSTGLQRDAKGVLDETLLIPSQQSFIRKKIGIRTSLATQKPIFQIPFFSLLTASLSRELISPFPANYFFSYLFLAPPGGMAE